MWPPTLLLQLVSRIIALAWIFLLAGGSAAWSDDGQEVTPSAWMEIQGQKQLLMVMDKQGHLPNTFTTDGCSGGLSSVWNGMARWWPGSADIGQEMVEIEACCIEHDRWYHVAGQMQTAQQGYEARLQADEALHACVLTVDTGGENARVPSPLRQVLAAAMYRAVRIGGAPCTGLSWRWGYGFPNCW